jgi:nucleoid DNA-binding protein
MTKRPVITKTDLAKHLRHRYPAAIPSVTTALVLVDALLEALRKELLDCNVIALDGIGSFKLLPAKKMRKVTPQGQEWIGEAAPRMSVSLYTEFSSVARDRMPPNEPADVICGVKGADGVGKKKRSRRSKKS